MHCDAHGPNTAALSPLLADTFLAGSEDGGVRLFDVRQGSRFFQHTQQQIDHPLIGEGWRGEPAGWGGVGWEERELGMQAQEQGLERGRVGGGDSCDGPCSMDILCIPCAPLATVHALGACRCCYAVHAVEQRLTSHFCLPALFVRLPPAACNNGNTVCASSRPARRAARAPQPPHQHQLDRGVANAATPVCHGRRGPSR